MRAYLKTYSQRVSQQYPVITDSTAGTRILAIVDLVQLHRTTSAFSAQGLNRTLAGAVEAASLSCSKLIIAECYTPLEAVLTPEMDETSAERRQPSSAWDEEVSILNVTTKSFGMGERGWVGRTVNLRTVAARWCIFEAVTGA